MKHIINILPIRLIIGMSLFYACHKASGQVQTSTLQDNNGNSYAIKTMPDNKTWMITNLKIDIPGSYCYENAEQKCREYGRLYTWTSAQEGCRMLGEGWRLPTNEEWRQMTEWYGGVYGDSKDSGRAAYQALLYGGKAGFNALLGGGRGLDDDKYARLEQHGFYWTATESDTATAWFYNFGKGSRKLFGQNDGEKRRAFSVRCIRDAGSLKKSDN